MIWKYNLLPLVINGFIYLEIHKGVYGLPQAVQLENYLLSECLAPKGCFQFTHITGLWRQKCCTILFPFAVDNFGVNDEGKEHDNHFMSAIRKFYPISEYCTGSLYCGITLK